MVVMSVVGPAIEPAHQTSGSFTSTLGDIHLFIDLRSSFIGCVRTVVVGSAMPASAPRVGSMLIIRDAHVETLHMKLAAARSWASTSGS